MIRANQSAGGQGRGCDTPDLNDKTAEVGKTYPRPKVTTINVVLFQQQGCRLWLSIRHWLKGEAAECSLVPMRETGPGIDGRFRQPLH